MTAPMLTVWRFWTKFIPDPQPNDPLHMRGVDWVEYGPVGSKDRSTTEAPVSMILDRLQPMQDRGNPAILMAHERASIISRAYKAWKEGNAVPVDGTPLAAWNGVSPEAAEVLKLSNIRTVEEIAALTDAHMERIRLPHLRELIRQAKAFIDSADQVRFAASLTERERENAALKAELADAKEQGQAQMTALMAKLNEMAEEMARMKEAEQGAKGKKKVA